MDTMSGQIWLSITGFVILLLVIPMAVNALRWHREKKKEEDDDDLESENEEFVEFLLVSNYA